jgi:hypothetical protein
VSSLLVDSEPEIKAILESSVRHNQLNGVTGMLLYYSGQFMQVLEGGEAQVIETYARICDDKRHRQITSLSIRKVQQRHFEKWSMGFKHVSVTEIAQHPAFAALLAVETSAATQMASPGLALEMLSLFGNGTVWQVGAQAS